jgi:hypothetical protein
MCAYTNHEQLQMDYVLFTPPRPFFQGTRVEFDTTLEDCWYGLVVLLFRVRVKLDKKGSDERSVQMDCECTMIECLYEFAPGRCACARFAVGLQHKVCISSALCMHCVCTICASSLHINQSLVFQYLGEYPPGGRRLVRAGLSSCISRRSRSSTLCQSLPHPGEAASHPCWGPLHHSCGAERQQEGALSSEKMHTRTGGQELAAVSTTSARGPCAGPQTTPRSQ